MDHLDLLIALYIFDSALSWLAPFTSLGLPEGALYCASCHTSRFELRSVMVCRAHVSPGSPVGPSGVFRLAVGVEETLVLGRVTVGACISIWVAGSTGIDVSAVSMAADAIGVGAADADRQTGPTG